MITKGKPHVIYLHLGINDIQKGTPLSETMNRFKTFDEMLQRVKPSTKLVILFPLLNGESYRDRQVFAMRQSLLFFINKYESNTDPKLKRLYPQRNRKFFLDSGSTQKQNSIYFADNDPLHLSSRGRTAITSTVRATLETILKEFTPLP